MSSLEIAELTGKEHKNVIADIREMFSQLKTQPREFEGFRTDERGKDQPLFNLDRKHTICLTTGYSIPQRMAVVERLEQWESGEITHPMSPAEILKLQAEAMIQTDSRLKALEAKKTVNPEAFAEFGHGDFAESDYP